MIEVDLARQPVIVADDGVPSLVINTSTGSGEYYRSGGHTYRGTTPTGTFRVTRQIDGERISHLGALWRPKYFYRGYALHGSPSVPAHRASHGCVRLTDPAIDYLWSADVAPVGTPVVVH